MSSTSEIFWRCVLAAFVLQLAAVAAVATAQEEMSSEAQANNPLADMVAFNIQNYYYAELSELDGQNANAFWLRYAQPFGQWLFRASLPISWVPDLHGPQHAIQIIRPVHQRTTPRRYQA